jgi:hypothetical protein
LASVGNSFPNSFSPSSPNSPLSSMLSISPNVLRNGMEDNNEDNSENILINQEQSYFLLLIFDLISSNIMTLSNVISNLDNSSGNFVGAFSFADVYNLSCDEEGLSDVENEILSKFLFEKKDSSIEDSYELHYIIWNEFSIHIANSYKIIFMLYFPLLQISSNFSLSFLQLISDSPDVDFFDENLLNNNYQFTKNDKNKIPSRNNIFFNFFSLIPFRLVSRINWNNTIQNLEDVCCYLLILFNF